MWSHGSIWMWTWGCGRGCGSGSLAEDGCIGLTASRCNFHLSSCGLLPFLKGGWEGFLVVHRTKASNACSNLITPMIACKALARRRNQRKSLPLAGRAFPCMGMPFDGRKAGFAKPPSHPPFRKGRSPNFQQSEGLEVTKMRGRWRREGEAPAWRCDALNVNGGLATSG